MSLVGFGNRRVNGLIHRRDSDSDEAVPPNLELSLDNRPYTAIASRLLGNTGFSVRQRSFPRFAIDVEHGLGHPHLVVSDAVLLAEVRE